MSLLLSWFSTVPWDSGQGEISTQDKLMFFYLLYIGLGAMDRVGPTVVQSILSDG